MMLIFHFSVPQNRKNYPEPPQVWSSASVCLPFTENRHFKFMHIFLWFQLLWKHANLSLMWVPVVPVLRLVLSITSPKTSFGGGGKTPPELPQVASCSENYLWVEKSASTCERWDESVCLRRPPQAAPTVDLWKWSQVMEGRRWGTWGRRSHSLVIRPKNQPPDHLKPRSCSPGLVTSQSFCPSVAHSLSTLRHRLACLNWTSAASVFSCMI